MFYSGFPLPHTAAALGFLLPVTGLPVAAHDAESGWTYPLSCCSDYDCREVADAAVLERPEGYVIKVTGEVIPMTSRKVKPSPDGVFHWCWVAGRDDGATICLFVPPRGF
ncbi:hypothetical protein [Neoaquamicrobium sediminum]|uniref:hypothetical protein n=1 Tax=Neoaquamicrobium sediminum TaxID=1849104 RepID=UPI003BAC26A7